MPPQPVRYRSPEEDSERWHRFAPRPGDVVISTRSKSGTTWMQMICALLVFRTDDLPRPLAELSPWLDWRVIPLDEVLATLAAQTHRRIIKTHTPLDGLPIADGTTYITVGRRPLDQAVSLYHQGANLERARIAELAGERPPQAGDREATRPPLAEWLRAWIDAERDPIEHLDSLPGVMRHLGIAWSRRHQPNMVLVHYDDLLGDLVGQMRRLADRLGIAVGDDELARLARAAGFEAMRARSGDLAPDPRGVLKSTDAFFRRGRSGAGAEALGAGDLARYRARVGALGPPDLVAWLDRDEAPTRTVGA